MMFCPLMSERLFMRKKWKREGMRFHLKNIKAILLNESMSLKELEVSLLREAEKQVGKLAGEN